MIVLCLVRAFQDWSREVQNRAGNESKRMTGTNGDTSKNMIACFACSDGAFIITKICVARTNTKHHP